MLIATLLLVGIVLVAMTVSEPLVRRSPLSPALVYLLAGWAGGEFLTPPLPALDLPDDALFVRVLCECAVLLSLFTIGMKIRIPASWSAWRVPVLLATSGMLWSVMLAALLAWLLLPLNWPTALLLGAILAPTDPVLASELHIQGQHDRDGLRIALSAEGALNDGTAYPVVMLALGLLGLHELGEGGRSWLTMDLLWSVGAGLVLGVACGRGIGGALQHKLRASDDCSWDELLYLGTIALIYGLSLLLHVSAFLAVFAAGATLLRQHPSAALAPDTRPLGNRLEDFGASCERLVEALMVLLIGVAMSLVQWSFAVLLFALLMLLIVRPLSVVLGLLGGLPPLPQRRLLAWFGIRGVGSVFYLSLAIESGLAGREAELLLSACLVCIALSIGLHGISATPLMNVYQRRRRPRT